MEGYLYMVTKTIAYPYEIFPLIIKVPEQHLAYDVPLYHCLTMDLEKKTVVKIWESYDTTIT